MNGIKFTQIRPDNDIFGLQNMSKMYKIFIAYVAAVKFFIYVVLTGK